MSIFNLRRLAFLGGVFLHALVSQGQTNVPTVTIGNQVWAEQNLQVRTFNDGSEIQFATSLLEWHRLSASNQPMAFEYYDTITGTTIIYYNVQAINDPRGLAPEGFRIPTVEDYYSLMVNQGPGTFSQTVQKLCSNKGWYNTDKYGVPSDASGFNAYPTGVIAYKGRLNQIGYYSKLWLSGGYCISFSLRGYEQYPPSDYSFVGMPVRCIKNVSYPQRLVPMEINGVTWSQNILKTKHFRNGDPINIASSLTEFQALGDSQLPAVYITIPPGFIEDVYYYNDYAVRDSRGLVPVGWKLPSKNDYLNVYGPGPYTSTSMFKFMSEEGWLITGDGEPNDETGFSLQPFGAADGPRGYLRHRYSYLWTSDGEGSASIVGYQPYVNFSTVNRKWGLPVRCLYAGAPVVDIGQVEMEPINCMSAMVSCNLEIDGSSSFDVVQRGICYSTQNPTPNLNSRVMQLINDAGLQSGILEVTPDNTYYLRGFVKYVITIDNVKDTMVEYGPVFHQAVGPCSMDSYLINANHTLSQNLANAEPPLQPILPSCQQNGVYTTPPFYLDKHTIGWMGNDYLDVNTDRTVGCSADNCSLNPEDPKKMYYYTYNLSSKKFHKYCMEGAPADSWAEPRYLHQGMIYGITLNSDPNDPRGWEPTYEIFSFDTATQSIQSSVAVYKYLNGCFKMDFVFGNNGKIYGAINADCPSDPTLQNQVFEYDPSKPEGSRNPTYFYFNEVEGIEIFKDPQAIVSTRLLVGEGSLLYGIINKASTGEAYVFTFDTQSQELGILDTLLKVPGRYYGPLSDGPWNEIIGMYYGANSEPGVYHFYPEAVNDQAFGSSDDAIKAASINYNYQFTLKDGSVEYIGNNSYLIPVHLKLPEGTPVPYRDRLILLNLENPDAPAVQLVPDNIPADGYYGTKVLFTN
ncbi:FISUMP domain-containing protein [Phaeocystidibacter marisrubri]|uniref:Fibrobacter succinogenes major paralogous domain-containing protein n=1 Tax=Phaeocystidibacter marisrubri TaxID=1577780 RepID=A0A6L3ZDW4_9FLAO|nr:FISUMP domain-containing protein [Phaeocystidibacter marisrubri]KAB2816011.1 hypothetical protein F8C82_09965 [Phaeocystidibacter marisrubri]